MPTVTLTGASGAQQTAITRAAAAAGVGRILLNLAARVSPTASFPVFANLRAVRDVLVAGPVPVTTLQPTVFMDNLLAPWSLPAITQGTFAYAAAPDTPIAWISHRTLADAALAAATRDVGGQSFDIGGAPLTGTEVAALLAAHLGRPISYASIPLDAFTAGLNAGLGAPAGDRIAELYRDLAANPDTLMSGRDGLAALGVEPEEFAAFIARNTWTATA